jgi:hypothetical protein
MGVSAADAATPLSKLNMILDRLLAMMALIALLEFCEAIIGFDDARFLAVPLDWVCRPADVSGIVRPPPEG